jgi:hypothetical protein
MTASDVGGVVLPTAADGVPECTESDDGAMSSQSSSRIASG